MSTAFRTGVAAPASLPVAPAPRSGDAARGRRRFGARGGGNAQSRGTCLARAGGGVVRTLD